VTAARANRLPRWFVVTLAAAPAAFLLVFYAWPFATLLTRGLRLDAVTVVNCVAFSSSAFISWWM